MSHRDDLPYSCCIKVNTSAEKCPYDNSVKLPCVFLCIESDGNVECDHPGYIRYGACPVKKEIMEQYMEEL